MIATREGVEAESCVTVARNFLTLNRDEKDEDLYQRALIRSISVCTASVNVLL